MYTYIDHQIHQRNHMFKTNIKILNSSNLNNSVRNNEHLKWWLNSEIKLQYINKKNNNKKLLNGEIKLQYINQNK